jgi:hypothetical protein
MALNTQMSYAAVNAEANALSALLNSGYLRIYDGAQPANADTALSGQTLLAELRFSSTAAPSASNGVLTFNTVTSDTSANNTGTATWYRCLSSNGTSVVMDGTVGTSGANLNLNSVSIQSGAEVAVTSFTHTIPRA